jgi:hypothetical protein
MKEFGIKLNGAEKMMEFNWILNSGLSVSDRSILIKDLERFGYNSVMLAFNQGNVDPFINATNLMQYSKKLNFIIALRTYALTATYCAMQCRAFEEIDGRQPILNLINGTADQDQELFNLKTKSIQERRLHTRKFAEDLKSQCNAIIGFGGSSDQTIKNVIDLGEISFNLSSDINNEIIDNLNKNNKKLIVRYFVTVTDELVDQKIIHAKLTADTVGDDGPYKIEDRLNNNSIYGTEKEIANFFINQYKKGIKSFIISAHDQNNINEIRKVHSVISLIRKMGY